MPKSTVKAWSRTRKKFNLWIKRVPAIVLFSISVVLLTQTLYCFSNAQNYPVDVSDLTRTRYDVTISPQNREVYSIPIFLPCPVNSKSTYEITLVSLEETELKCTIVSYLKENCTINWQQTRLLSINETSDLVVTLNGQTLIPFLSDVNGTQFYTVNGFSLTDTSQVETLVISFNIKRALSNNQFIKIPWIFNENYAQYIGFPAFGVPLGENMTSDVNTLKVDFELPFRQLVSSGSGWMDEFDEPSSYWIFINSSAWYEPYVEYPINQTVEASGNTYYFKTSFSKENVANFCYITIIPNFFVIFLFLYFVASPLFISLIEYGINRYGKRKKDSKAKTNTKGYAYLVFSAIGKYYLTPIIGYVTYGATIGQLFPLLSYLQGITNLIWAPLILGYPLIFYVVLHKTILKT